MKDHILSFPAYESHYTRAHHTPGRKYRNPSLDIRKMYNLYKEKCNELNKASVNEWTYRKVFNNDFNLHFYHPRKDTCQKCDFFKSKVNATTNEEEKCLITQDHDLHLEKAEKARNCLKSDQDLIGSDPDCYFGFTFDLQKALPYPKLTVSVAYYKRNMYVYNLGIHNFHNQSVGMYVWDETIASRGSQEVASCIAKHITDGAKPTQKHVIAYSDACSGQNRNIKLALMWMKIVLSSDSFEIIDHKFMVSGHSFLPNDRDFGVIENSIRKQEQIYVPDHYYNLIRKSRKKILFLLIN